MTLAISTVLIVKAWLCWRAFSSVVSPWAEDSRANREPQFVVNTIITCVSLALIVACWSLLP